MRWRVIYETAAYRTFFHEHRDQQVVRAIETTVEGVVDRVDSKSYISALEPSEMEALNAKVRAVLNGATDKAWIDREKGLFGTYDRSLPLSAGPTPSAEYPYKTDLVLIPRSSTPFEESARAGQGA